MSLKKLRALLEQHAALGSKIKATAGACWPEGADVEWDRNGHAQFGVVIANYTRGNDVRLLCKNHKTDKQIIVRYSSHTDSLYGSSR